MYFFHTSSVTLPLDATQSPRPHSCCPQYRFLKLAYSDNNRCELFPFKYCTAFDTHQMVLAVPDRVAPGLIIFHPSILIPSPKGEGFTDPRWGTLKLLHLQLQAVKVDARAAATMADEKLRVINQSLSQQQRELKLECRQLEAMIREEFHVQGFGVLSVPVLQKALAVQATTARADNKGLRLDLVALKKSDVEFKRWLKIQREAAREEEWIDEFMLDELMRAKSGRRSRRG